MADEATVSLYLDLERGETADIEVVSRAAIAFSAAIKALAAEIAPGVDVRVDLVSGTEGSLSLNSLIKGAGLLVTKERLINIALGIALYFALETRDYTVGRLLDHLTGNDEASAETHLSEEDVQRLAAAFEKRVAEKHVQQIFKEVERDPAITGVGATTKPGKRPAIVVPRAEFRERSGVVIRQETVLRRTVPERMSAVLVSPVLVEGTRRWKFRGPYGEFGAPIKDASFTDRVLSGTTSVPMVAGILMDIEVETEEELRDGVWVPGDHVVTHVFGLQPPATVEQASLFATGRDQGDDDN